MEILVEEKEILLKPERVFENHDAERLKLAEKLGCGKFQKLAAMSLKVFATGNAFGWYAVKKGFFQFFLRCPVYLYYGYHDSMWEIEHYPQTLPYSALLKTNELLEMGIEKKNIRIVDPELSRIKIDPFLIVFIDTGRCWGESPCFLIHEWTEKKS